MTARVLVDTGAIYAFVVHGDANHAQARRFVKSWLARKGVFVLSDVVFAETMTLLKTRVGGDVAIRVGRELRDNAAYAWVALGPDGERDTWSVFQRFDDKEWSYTDCALLVLCRRLDVSGVFSFDRHIAQMPGLKRVPRP
jgi:predicted nucleic acid-binding protein